MNFHPCPVFVVLCLLDFAQVCIFVVLDRFAFFMPRKTYKARNSRATRNISNISTPIL